MFSRQPLSSLAVASVSLGLVIGPLYAAPPLTPQDYKLHPALELSLFAREPDVVDPVALTWDEEGNIFVVEMRDYPYGFGPDRKPGGTVRLLQDKDGDGKIDRVTLFATNLSFPTAIAPWNGGVLVAAPPEIIFLKDTDGDGKADVREVMLKGFVLGVTDSNMNGLRWGLDNLVHGVNGGNGGEIISPRKPGPPVSIRNLDFSFDPGTGDFTPTYHTSGGFGLVFDNWGHSFVTYNINHIQQRHIPARYLNRFPGFPPIEATESISDHEDMSRIYPISEPETRVNHPEQSGHFSSAGGMGFIGTSAYPGDLYGSILVCDVVGNLVHRDVLSAPGPFVATRSPQETNSEFFASRDPAFRPIGVEVGPDGALYLIDMQRDVIEHPDYIPEKIRNKLNLRAGEDRGRIYRITPKGGLSPRKPNLRGASAAELVDHLSHSNSWWRYTAQRLLVERRTEPGWTNSAIPKLKAVVVGKAPLGRLHALWTLRGLGALDESLVGAGLSDPEPGIRENALLLAETMLPGSKQLRKQLLSMAGDTHGRVRFQAALTIGQLDPGSDVTAALIKIVFQDNPYRWSRVAVLSSLSRDEEEIFEGDLTNTGITLTKARVDLLREICDLIGARASTGGGAKVARVLTLLARFPAQEESKIAALEGLQSGLERSGAKPSGNKTIASALEQLSLGDSAALLGPAWKLSRTLDLPQSPSQQQALAQAKKRVLDATRPPLLRQADIRLLALGSYADVSPALFTLLNGQELAEIQLVAIEALRQFDDLDIAKKLLERWRSLSPAARSPVLNLLLQRLPFHAVVVSALESGQLTVGELNLDLEQRRRLLWESTPELRERASRLIGDGEYANRKTVVEEWLRKLPSTGDATRGRAVFEKTCAQCHAMDGVGQAVGPDLGALAHRSVEDLLSNILDPNMAINPSYIAYTVETASGEIESGILQSESADAVVLLQALGKKVTVPRKQIKRLQSSGLSLMPEGLEAGLTPNDVRDLIAFLQRKR